jgi:ABC-2 type transport system ATP-binding protein
MNNIISVAQLSKSYGNDLILSNINFTAQAGEIIGVIGTNGAGKTTLLKSLLGLTQAKGDISICGLNPYKNQAKLMEKVSFIADTATLPKWITADQLLAYMNEMHPNFSIEAAKAFLSTTNINGSTKVSKLSKGMVTQLHLALVIAVKSELLVLDEPTLGLDIIRRKAFYNQLLEHYFDDNNTIVITTHQIEEVEHILTRAVFIERGQILADFTIDELEKRFFQLTCTTEKTEEMLALQPIYQQKTLAGTCYVFDGVSPEKLKLFGKVNTPSLSDVFVALASTAIKEQAHA